MRLVVPDLDEPAPRLRHDLGDPEPAADLDQLAARHDDVAAAGQRGQREEHRGRVVVHDEPGLGAARLGEQRAGVVMARAPPAGVEVVLEVGGGAADGVDLRPGLGAERCAPEVGVQQHARRVEHGAQERPPAPLDDRRRVTHDRLDVDRWRRRRSPDARRRAPHARPSTSSG